jgi:hypothetical protein
MDRNDHMGPRVFAGTIVAGLRRGLKFGIIASSDSHDGFPAHWGMGRFGVWAPELSRQAVWDALLAGRTIGVTGDRIRLDVSSGRHTMGESFAQPGPVQLRVTVVGCDVVDRIELIRNGEVIDTYSHAGNWSWLANGSAVGKWRIEFGWGPDRASGFPSTEIRYRGTVRVPRGRIIGIERCFSAFDQTAEQAGDHSVTVDIRTGQQNGLMLPQHRGGVVLEVASPTDGPIDIDLEGLGRQQLTWAEARESRVIAGLTEAHDAVQRCFNLTPDQVNNPDLHWHNAHKVLLHRAVPRSSYQVEHTFIDRRPPAGENSYYVRVSQLNGQMAWSSPIWVTNEL